MSAEVQTRALMLEWEFRKETDILEYKPREHTHCFQTPQKKFKKKKKTTKKHILSHNFKIWVMHNWERSKIWLPWFKILVSPDGRSQEKMVRFSWTAEVQARHKATTWSTEKKRKRGTKTPQTFTICSQSNLQNKSNANNFHSPLCVIFVLYTEGLKQNHRALMFSVLSFGQDVSTRWAVIDDKQQHQLHFAG